jgi:hypothetical protein
MTLADLRLVAHAAPPGCVDLWVGVSGVADAPDLAFTVDGVPAAPVVLRPLEAVRIGEASPAPGRPRTFTAGFRFPGIPGEVDIEVRGGGASSALRTRPIPARLPDEGWFNVWLGSCYDRNTEAAPGLAGRVASHLASSPDTRPDLTFLVGDQVYLDVPLTEVIGRFGEPGLGGITAQFEEDYRLTWMSHLTGLLQAAPIACTPDDHEFWNNYPARVPWLPRTLRARGRMEWEQAARRCYDAFQRSVGMPDPIVLDLGPVSFFVLDTRTWRRVDRSACALPDHLAALEAWAEGVRERGQTGVFITGQTLFKTAASLIGGLLTDFELANHADYLRIIGALRRAATPERPLLCLTGDVHFGRVVQASDTKGRPLVYEVISSPLSLCSDPRSAHQPLLSSLFHRWFGEPWLHLNRPWPRHPSPALPPLELPAPAPLAPLQCVSRYAHRGNQLAIIGFRRGRREGSLKVRVGFVTLGPREEQWEPTWVGPFDPRNGIDVLGAFGRIGARA